MPDFTIYGYGDKFSGDDILFQEQKRSDSKAIYQCLLKKPLVPYKSVDAFIAALPAALHCQAIHILELSRNKKIQHRHCSIRGSEHSLYPSL